MKTSDAGRAAIVAREGRRLMAYRDSVGVLTIGVGHTGRMAPPKVTPGMRISEAQCDAFLAADLAPVEAAINANVRVPMSQNEFDAMASLGFNIGVGGLRRSSVIRKLNLGDVTGAADAFMAWSKPSVLAGRRRAEKAQFLRPDTSGGPASSAMVDVRRGDVLRSKAVETGRASGSDTRLAAGAAVVSAGVAVAQPFVPHHHGVLWIAGLAFGLVALCAALAAVRARLNAAALAANAAAHGTERTQSVAAARQP